MIDAQELAVEAAWISGDVGRRTHGKVQSPSKYYDARKVREYIITGQEPKKEADFTIYNKLKESVSTFDWAAHYVPKKDKRKKKDT